METTHIDTIAAATIEVGDLIDRWDDDSEKYVIETVTSLEDAGDYIEVYTEESPDGFALPADLPVRLYLYVYE
jgi:hypothetical protein